MSERLKYSNGTNTAVFDTGIETSKTIGRTRMGIMMHQWRMWCEPARILSTRRGPRALGPRLCILSQGWCGGSILKTTEKGEQQVRCYLLYMELVMYWDCFTMQKGGIELPDSPTLVLGIHRLRYLLVLSHMESLPRHSSPDHRYVLDAAISYLTATHLNSQTWTKKWYNTARILLRFAPLHGSRML